MTAGRTCGTAPRARTGLAWARLSWQRALGVPEAYVRADYLATNLFARNRAEGIVDAISKKLGLMKGLDTDIDSLFYAYNDYYDCAMAAVNANYGSFDAYLAEALDFGPRSARPCGRSISGRSSGAASRHLACPPVGADLGLP